MDYSEEYCDLTTEEDWDQQNASYAIKEAEKIAKIHKEQVDLIIDSVRRNHESN